MRIIHTHHPVVRYIWIIALLVLVGVVFPLFVKAREYNFSSGIIFPVKNGASYTNDFGAPRSDGRTHEGNDLIAPKHTPLLAAVDGVVSYVPYPEPDWGYAVFLQDTLGYRYYYLHINNDNPNTDDGNGGGINAYAPYIEQGAKVKAGQLLGWVGDSGNAEGTVSHLHFEIHAPDGTILNPYTTLQTAEVRNSVEYAPKQNNEILPFNQIPVGANIAVGDVNGDGKDEIIAAAGPGGGPQVRVFSSTGKLIDSFFAYDKAFRGGIDVAVGDVNGDGKAEIITGAGPGGGPHIRIFNRKGKVIEEFFAFDPAYRSGVFVSTADLNGDGKDSVIVGAGPNALPQVKIFKMNGTKTKQFLAFDKDFKGGVVVAGISAGEDLKKGRIITAAGPGDKSSVKIFSKGGKLKEQFYPYKKSFTGGIRVNTGIQSMRDSIANIIIAPASKGSGDIHVYSYQGKALTKLQAYEDWWRDGYDIALTSDNTALVSVLNTGDKKRRASIQMIELNSPRY